MKTAPSIRVMVKTTITTMRYVDIHGSLPSASTASVVSGPDLSVYNLHFCPNLNTKPEP